MLTDLIQRVARPLVLVAGISLLGAPGCQHSDAPIPARGEQFDTPWLMMGSEELRRDTQVGQPRTYYDDAGLLFVTVPVRNTIDKQLRVDYRYTFYDRNGAQLSTITGNVTIPERGQIEVAGNSTSPRAEGKMPFRLELRYPQVR